MKYLFIDTETTGLPLVGYKSPMDSDKWPRLVSVAYILCNERVVIDSNYFIIKPHGFIISSESTKVHGITTADALLKGCVLSDVLDKLKPIINECDFIVGHNVAFDINVLNAEFYRHNKSLPVSLKPYYCTMLLSKDFCQLPNNKYPTLEELYSILKGVPISDAHNAKSDVQAAMDCFWILKDIGIVKSLIAKPSIKIYPAKDNISWAAKQVSNDYAEKAYAFLTIAWNLINSTIITLEDFLLDDKIPVNLVFFAPILSKHYKDDMFKRFKDEITKTYKSLSQIKFDGKVYYSLNKEGKILVVTPPNIKDSIKYAIEMLGVKNVIEQFKLKDPDSPNVNLILENESCWIDIALEVVKTRLNPIDVIENVMLSQEDTDRYFISMLGPLNEIRFKKKAERLAPPNILQGPKTPPIPKPPSDPNPGGCMILLPLYLGISSTLFFIIDIILG